MDRLTDKEFKCMAEFCEAKNCLNYERNGCCGYKRYQRLAAYEDTGLSPEEIKTLGEKLKRSAVAIIEESKHQEQMLKMLELERAEAEGRLIVLPCKMGGVIYRAINSRPIKGDKPWKYIKQSRLTWNSLEGALRDFGKTVFLTREEAEAAMEGGDGA